MVFSRVTGTVFVCNPRGCDSCRSKTSSKLLITYENRLLKQYFVDVPDGPHKSTNHKNHGMCHHKLYVIAGTNERSVHFIFLFHAGLY